MNFELLSQYQYGLLSSGKNTELVGHDWFPIWLARPAACKFDDWMAE
jgi:hypothetical protein